MQLNFLKYKRVFAFGCSFTSYLHPTWADVIASECPQATFYNLGKSGAGNLNISCRIAEAHNVFNFCESDLVLVMWTSYCREDRFVDGRWLACGNVFGNDTYPKEWVKKFADPVGYVVRDLAQIYHSHFLLDNLPCDSMKLFSYEFDKETTDEGLEVSGEFYRKVTKHYRKFIDENIKNSLFELLVRPNAFYRNLGHTYLVSYSNQVQYDPHPHALSYLKYLQMLDLPLTDRSKQFAEESYEKLKVCATADEIKLVFPDVQRRTDESYIHLV